MVYPTETASIGSSTADANLVTANMVLPHQVESQNITKDYGRFVVSPLESGYGLTLGNALRRVLLSSLPGAAVTSIRVSDVHHEFSEIPNVREDMTQLILQIKQLRLLLHGVESSRLRLTYSGADGIVTAADIVAPAEVQIENPSLYLFTVDGPDVNMEMEFEVRSGRGFSPAEDRGRLPIGELPVDAIFSPIKRVNFEVERARVGQRTNYDRLVLELWTDGTIRPEEALAQAAQIMMHHLKVVAGVDEDWFQSIELPPQIEDEPTYPPLYDKPIEELDLSVRVFNSLKRTGITSVGDVLDMLNRGQDAMLAIRNFGEKSLDELEQKLQEKNYWPHEKTE
ncbi:MAG: DNA-directed RNA polymerase subunit alpha [Chloroflexota bacterium]|nr:DNA-directed RNA polymerase subunit alpha [Chloroflexota bacterium]MDE2854834.1 DNA-directed RNA polymerase subunit alpha [Chloroflexota bacterium]MDE2945853.1 DNA-directed RNA polymerase subunit alpha [Chloroflexota bacterium]